MGAFVFPVGQSRRIFCKRVLCGGVFSLRRRHKVGVPVRQHKYSLMTEENTTSPKGNRGNASNLTEEDRRRGGQHSAREQKRGANGRFAGKRDVST